jgi:hypothetical protein
MNQTHVVASSPLGAERAELLALKVLVTELKWQLALRRFARKYRADQPRAPAGSPEGGQWTAGPEGEQRTSGDHPQPTDFSASRRGRARGHHKVPVGVYGKLPLQEETRKVFDSATTGPIGLRATSESGELRGHYWDGPKGAHKAYNDAVEKRLNDFIDRLKIRPEQMTSDQARAFLQEIEVSQDPPIRDYNNAIRFLQLLRRLRTGRGRE